MSDKTLMFGGEEVTIDGNLLFCPNKQVMVNTNYLKEFMISKEKTLVGLSVDPNCPEDQQLCYASEDERFVHIGCLKETKKEFNKKYIQLIKHLNSQKCQKTEKSS